MYRIKMKSDFWINLTLNEYQWFLFNQDLSHHVILLPMINEKNGKELAYIL